MRKMTFTGMILFFLALGTAVAQNSAPAIDVVEIADNVLAIYGGRGANTYAVFGQDAVAIFDAKMDSLSATALLDMVRNRAGQRRIYLILTHSDGDHVDGIRYFPADMRVIAHENCLAEMLMDQPDGTPSVWNDPALRHYLPDITFHDRMTLDLGGTDLELNYFGIGHTSGDIVGYLADDRIALVGDQLMVHRPPLIHVHKNGNSFAQVRNLTTMLGSLDAATYLSGHADPLDRDAVMAQINEMTARQAKVKEMRDNGMNRANIVADFGDREGSLAGIIYDEYEHAATR